MGLLDLTHLYLGSLHGECPFPVVLEETVRAHGRNATHSDSATQKRSKSAMLKTRPDLQAIKKHLAFMVDSFKLRATVIQSHSQAFSCKVLHCLGSLTASEHHLALRQITPDPLGCRSLQRSLRRYHRCAQGTRIARPPTSPA